MNRLHLRYFLIALVGGAAAALALQTFIGTLLIPEKQAGMVGASFVAGWWGNLVAAFVIAMLAARKAARDLENPALGRIVGGAIGLWVGGGVLIGNAIAAALIASTNGASIRAGLVIFLGLISFGVAVLTATITGRETAQPPEQEEA
jgi:hypothetical protein